MEGTLREKLLEVAGHHHFWFGGAEDKERFITFWTNWKGDRGTYFDNGYADDWARRFARQDEYAFSDSTRVGMLIGIDGEENARARYYKSLIRAGWDPHKAAVQVEQGIQLGLQALASGEVAAAAAASSGRRAPGRTLGDAVNARVNAGLKASGILKVPGTRGSTVEQAVDRALGRSKLLGIGKR